MPEPVAVMRRLDNPILAPLRWIGSIAVALITTAAAGPGLAQPAMVGAVVPLCAGQSAVPGDDGRLLGHLAYPDASDADLVDAPPWFAIGPRCRVARDVAPDLDRLLEAAAANPLVGRRLRAVSCFRTVVHQRAVFCGKIGRERVSLDAADRARHVGPPGFSEHATGYAIDFGVRPSPGCDDVEPCMALSATGRWLIANAPRFGFELSFPAGNAQGVSWEPWHWRWVGATGAAPGAAIARQVFATARERFAADPAVDRDGGDHPAPPDAGSDGDRGR